MRLEKKGLTSKEAEKKLASHGPNEIREVSSNTPLKIFFRQIKNNFIVYLLFGAMLLSFFVGKNLTAYTIMVVIILVVSVGFFQEYRAEKAVHSLKGMLMPVSIVIRDGKEKEIPSTEIVPGDLLVLRSGEKIPADCLLLHENDLLVNESVLTGESKEVRKVVVHNYKKYSEKNTLFMGTFIVSGKCFAEVIHTGMSTKFGKIAGMISTAEKELPLQKKVNNIAKYMAIVGTIMAILTGLIMVLRAPGFDYDILIGALMIVIAVAVASFPEGFPVVLITALASGSYRMAKKNAIVNRMSIVETLGETTIICTDKTGTITKGEMTVKKIFCDNKTYEVTGTGFQGEGDFVLDKRNIEVEKHKTLSLLLRAAIFCNDSRIERTGEGKDFRVKGSPTEAALLIASAKAGLFKEDFPFTRQTEIPFTSERKMMTVLRKEKLSKVVYSKGALEVLLRHCKYIQREDGIFKFTEREKKRILLNNSEMTKRSFRTLSLAYKKSELETRGLMETDLVFLGFVAMEDPPREEVREALETCKTAGIKVKMITGDNKETALSVAREIGLSHGGVLEGEDLDKITDDELAELVRKISIFARVKPEHKLRIVKALKKNGEIVTMTGDGVNDAPALKESHIGVAMGKNGTDVSRAVADLTLKDDNFATIVDAVKEGRTIFTNIQKFSTYQISINFAQVTLIFFAILLGMPLPLVAIQILFMNLFTDELTAITMAFNPYSKDVMTSRPRKKSGIVTLPLLIMIAVAGLIMSLSSLAVFHYALTIGKSEAAARTLTLMTMVFFGITNAFNFRSFRKLTLNRSPFTNKPLVYASLLTIVVSLLVIYTPINKIFETVYIRPVFLLIPLFVSLIVIFVFDIFKEINERKGLFSEDLQHFNVHKGYNNQKGSNC